MNSTTHREIMISAHDVYREYFEAVHRELNAFQYAPLKMDTQILDCVYKHDIEKFNAYAHSESSIYKRGTYNPNKSQIHTLTIKLDTYQKSHLFIGVSKEKKKDVVHYYMPPNFAIIGFENNPSSPPTAPEKLIIPNIDEETGEGLNPQDGSLEKTMKKT